MISRRRLLTLALTAVALPTLAPFARRPRATQAQVTADSAPIRAWASDEAPLVARLPHGTVAVPTDCLDARDGRWIAVRDGSGRAGWSRAALWDVTQA